MIEIIHQDKDLVVINKPSGILVHKTELSRDRIYLLQELRNQLGTHVYPVHRLDRPTSGVMIFALSSSSASTLSQAMREHQFQKTYQCWVRGWFEHNGTCDYDLDEKSAITEFQCFQQIELAIPQRGFSTSRYSLIEAKPLTGRFHQIRLHLRHLRHPILGDTAHGDGFQNKLIRSELNIHRLLLHAVELEFPHPTQESLVKFQCPLPPEFSFADLPINS